MKKLLLASTALLGAVAISGAASAQQVVTKAPFTLQIGGSFSSYLGFNSGNNEGLTANKKEYDFQTETLLQFQATAKTDNGLTYGAQIRKYFSDQNVNSQNTTEYDRSFVFLQGSFGRFDFGDVNSVRAANSIAFNSVGPAWGNGLGSDGGMTAIFYNLGSGNFAAGGLTAQGNYPSFGSGSTSRRTKLNYTTPDFMGFQAGIAYIPSPNSAGTNYDRTDTVSASAVAINNRAAYRDAVEIGARYEAKFGGFTVTPRVTYLTASANKTSSAFSVEQGSSIYGGLSVEYMGLGVGVGYTNSFKSGMVKNNSANGAPFKDDTEGLVVQVGYTTGPWAVSGYYQWAQAEGRQDISGNDTMNLFEIAGGYTLAPGLQLWTAVHNFEFKNEGANKYNGTLFLLGTTVSF